MEMKKALRYTLILILLVIQSVFLGTMILESYQSHIWISILVIAIISVLLLIAYFKASLHHHEHDVEESLVVIWVPIGAIVCYFISSTLQLGSVIGAGITGTIASFLPTINKKSIYLSKLPVAIYCGAFVGMSSSAIAPSYGFIIAAGILAGVLLLYSKSLFLGVGGKLGTLAFASVTIITLLMYLLKK
ncbi:MAG: hypothetical protein DI598_11410 [Pseudopedobacter saltans]|uniref:Uncharacterized protein n=1 Tax=Pseudopedobacter saltans TaxID=151895 RepID=A0A2W5ET04_9SPHI|nr:MAG: hypothetical protein DI598_11410 [Pseudopedobacter saltans]